MSAAAYRVHRCRICDRAMEDACVCARCGVELHAACRRVRSRALQRDFCCPKCGALMAREGGDQALVLGVVLIVAAYVVFGGVLTRDARQGSGGGYGTQIVRAHRSTR